MQKAPISDTPRHADGQLGTNPAEYQRESRLLGEMEGVTAEERQTDEGERSGNRLGGVQRGDGEKGEGEKEGRRES